MTRYAAYPTIYAGIQFRSRLEAKWAAYFDARGWAWQYEPFDLHGYTPDFTIIPNHEHRYLGDTQRVHASTLVEVKPATQLGQLGAPIARILKTGWKGPWLVVGADPDIAMEGQGRYHLRRRYLGEEAPEAWAHACNVTQWTPNKEHGLCPKCGKPVMFLHKLVCR